MRDDMRVCLDEKYVSPSCEKINIVFMMPFKRFMNIRMVNGEAEITVSDETVTGSYSIAITQEGTHEYSLPVKGGDK